MEQKYKDAMVSNAQLYNEKTTLFYQVDALKDKWAWVFPIYSNSRRYRDVITKEDISKSKHHHEALHCGLMIIIVEPGH